MHNQFSAVENESGAHKIKLVSDFCDQNARDARPRNAEPPLVKSAD